MKNSGLCFTLEKVLLFSCKNVYQQVGHIIRSNNVVAYVALSVSEQAIISQYNGKSILSLMEALVMLAGKCSSSSI